MMRRYLKSQFMVLLFGGLVGPIFVITYFAAGQPSSIKALYYFGLIITAADVLTALVVANFGAKSAVDTAELERDGVLALAQITGITETGTRINDQPLVKLQLHITGSGFAPFDSQDRVIASVTRLGNITSRKLVVVVNPVTAKYRIDWERSALVNGLVPAQFTLSEDNKTYDLSGQAGPLMEILRILKDHGVSLQQMVDIRSNPVLRQQIQEVVHRSVAAVQPESLSVDQPESGPVVVPPRRSAAERLQELETLRATGALTDEEYASRRAQIIAEI
ncbi:MAG: SHOCT domain-containing protein [Mycobacteriaceae bacterium]|nr:SHOCT domain-containing protein [Mycobacteriaceae bacterium]